jgi:hypothetical protein
MADIETIMQGLETRLATIAGLRVSDTVKGEISPPSAMVGLPQDVNYHAAMGTNPKFDLTFEIWVFTSKAWDRTGQLQLTGYLNPNGPKSIRAAIEADRQLGGVVDDCHVARGRAVTVEEFGVIGYFGGVWTVPVFARGT